MVDKNLREMQTHGDQSLPMAAYEWHGDQNNGFSLECHWHEEWELFCLTEGRAAFAADGERILLTAGDVVFIPGDCMHMAEGIRGQAYRYRSVVFHPRTLDGLAESERTMYPTPFFAGENASHRLFTKDATGGIFWDGFHKLFDVLQEQPMAYEILAKAYLYEWIAHGIRLSGKRAAEILEAGRLSALMKQVVTYIHENLGAVITVGELAKMAMMSEGHFTRQFRRYTARSPIEYVIHARMLRAMELLTHTDEKLVSIALDTGFRSMSYFIRVFESNADCSPTEYRNRMRRTKRK